MLKIIWIIDATFLIAGLGIAMFATGQDAAGRGAIWMFPIVFAAVLAGSWSASRLGHPALANALAAAGVIMGLVMAGLFVRAQQRAQREDNGAMYWREPVQRKLASAIAQGDTAGIREAIAAHANANEEGTDFTTPLMFAVRRRPEVVGALIRMGADPNHVRPDVVSALSIALTAFDPAFQQLLDNGANPNGVGEHDAPIIFDAIRSQIPSRYTMLVQHGANVHALDATGRTTIIAAAESSQWKIALDLLARGVDVDAVATGGVTLSSIVQRVRASLSDDADFQQFLAALEKLKSH